jgi:type I restriction enzyme, S subunit
MNWETRRLGELCRMVKGVSPTLKTPPGPYPFVVTAEFRRTSDTWQLEGPAVCIPLISSTGHGDAALHRVHYQEGKFALANLLVALLPNEASVCEAKYLYHLLMARKDDLLVPLMQGTANVSLKEQDIARVEIPLPPLAEQRRTVARIEELAAEIHEARTLRLQAAKEAEAIIPATARKRLATVKAEQTELRQWLDNTRDGIQTGPFGAQLNRSEFKDIGVPLLTIGNVQYGGLDLTKLIHVSEEKAQQLQRYAVREGDILFARMGTVGRCCVVTNRFNGWLINYHIIRVALDTARIDPRYVHWTIRASSDVEEYLEEKIRGATRAGVNSKIVASLPCRVPSLSEQRRIVAELDALHAEVDALKRLQAETAAELDALLPSILDKAFKGKL